MAIQRRTFGSSDQASLAQLADEELMPLVARGSALAFEVIYDRHSAAVFSLAHRICGGRTGAEEVAQEAFLAIWRNAARYDRALGSVRTWLLGVAHNRAIDAIRRATVHERRQAGDESAAERIEAPERTEVEAARREEARAMRVLVERLPADQRRVIDLAYFGGFTHEQIAQMLDVPLGTVKGRMRLALEKMRANLGPTQVAL